MVSQESTCLSTGNSWDKKWSRKMKQSKKLWSRLTLEPKHSSIFFNQCNFLSLNKIIVLHMYYLYYLYYAQCEDRNCTTVNDSASVGIPHSSQYLMEDSPQDKDSNLWWGFAERRNCSACSNLRMNHWTLDQNFKFLGSFCCRVLRFLCWIIPRIWEWEVMTKVILI